jgi:diguanylate cyclase (GGDEF)-like protein
VGESVLGILFVDRAVVHEEDIRLLQIFANQAAVAIQNSQLYELATLDSLTGVYARGFLDKMMIRELQTAFRSGQTISFILIDMDNLKGINDKGGHLVGDQALNILGTELRGTMRMTDMVGRFGGDEFLVILPNTDLDGAILASQRIYNHLETQFVIIDDKKTPLKVSTGLCTLTTPNIKAMKPLSMLSFAYFQTLSNVIIATTDRALYDAKTNGGNQMSYGGTIKWIPLE